MVHITLITSFQLTLNKRNWYFLGGDFYKSYQLQCKDTKVKMLKITNKKLSTVDYQIVWNCVKYDITKL